jgi:hypothetical protein
MFFKPKIKNNVTHIYFSSLLNVLMVIEKSADLSGRNPSTFSLNYKEDRDIKCLENSLLKLREWELEYLDICDDLGEVIVNIGVAFAYLDLKQVIYKLTFVKEFDNSFEKEKVLYNECSAFGEIVYGYTRFLRDDFIPTTESKLKKGLFGGVSSQGVKEETKWLIHPKEILSGAIKGFYPLNYWNNIAFSVAQQHANNLFDSQQRKRSVFVMDSQSQRKLSSIPLLKKYTHFSET